MAHNEAVFRARRGSIQKLLSKESSVDAPQPLLFCAAGDESHRSHKDKRGPFIRAKLKGSLSQALA